MDQPRFRGKVGLGSSRERWPDSVLVSACLHGEEPAWDALIERYKGLIYKVALSMGLSKEDASDVLQDVSMLLVNHLDELRDGDKVAHWLAITTKREVWRLVRRRKPCEDIAGLEHVLSTENARSGASERSSDPAEVLLAVEDQFLVRHALALLPTKCRRLIECLYCEIPPLSYAEAAARLKMPVNSVGPSRIRCLKSFKKLLIEQGF